MKTPPSLTLIERAILFGRAAHNSINQKRKYTGEDYTVHTEQVAYIVMDRGGDDEMVIAALLHDVVEDVNVFPYNLKGIEGTFGKRVAGLVEELSDVYTHEAFPNMNRKTRKQNESTRMGQISADAQSIKFADMLSNGYDIVKHDKGFGRVYLREIEENVRGMVKGDTVLLCKVMQMIHKLKAEL